MNNSFENEMLAVFGAITSNTLQRSADWFEARRGVFTGSKIKYLMSCTQSAARMEWGRVEKVLSIGDAAKKYIYIKARERQTGKVIKEASSLQMKYGTDNEAEIKRLFLESNENYLFEEVGFTKINDYLGASPDGKITDIKTNEVFAGELKANTTFATEYERQIEPFEQRHIDFWQVQTEILALKTKRALYITAEPPEDIFAPVIERVAVQIVAASPIHQNAILQRARLGNDIINLYLAGVPFFDAIEKAVIEFEE